MKIHVMEDEWDHRWLNMTIVEIEVHGFVIVLAVDEKWKKCQHDLSVEE